MAHDYKAFISYSHAADGKLAPALQHGLQNFACPWNQLRAIRVFRDKTGLTTTPGLWSWEKPANVFPSLLRKRNGDSFSWIARFPLPASNNQTFQQYPCDCFSERCGLVFAVRIWQRLLIMSKQDADLLRPCAVPGLEVVLWAE